MGVLRHNGEVVYWLWFYEGLIHLPLAAFGMIMTSPYLLISMFKK
jgi:hypothetical protein